MEAGTSPISSRKTVPVSACSNLPGLVFIAPVKAPFSNPNSSLSIRFSGRAVQLIFTNGASASGRIRGAPLDGICQNRYAALRSPTFGLLTIEHSIRMTTLVKIHRKGQMTLPTKLRSLAGISEGDLVEAAFQRGKIVLTPKLVIDRSRFPAADEEYTRAQRRKGQMTLPTKLRSLAGITEGDLVEAAFQRGKIVITPKLVIDRSKFPNADDEYPRAQRRMVDARLAK